LHLFFLMFPLKKEKNKITKFFPKKIIFCPPPPVLWRTRSRSIACNLGTSVHFLSVYFFSVYTRSTPVDKEDFVFQFLEAATPSLPFSQKTPLHYEWV
jgi:hypothetical protein